MNSLGNVALLGLANATPSEDKSNPSVLKYPSSGILDQFISLASLVVKNKSFPSCTMAFPSMGSDSASTRTVNHPSPFHQDNPLNNLLAHIVNKNGSESNAVILPSSSRVYPFKS